MKKKFYTKSIFIGIASYLLILFPSITYSQKYLVKDDNFNSNKSTTNGTTYAIEVLNDAVNKGKVLVAGFFNHYNGVYVPGKIAKLNYDGTLDNSFVAPAINGGINSIAVQPWDGKVIIAGDFTLSVGGVTYNNIARLLPDGTIDPTFNPTGGGTSGGSGNGNINKVLVLNPEKQIVIGGGIGTYNGTTISGGQGGLIIINENGGLVKDAKVQVGIWTGPGCWLNDMALAPDGKIVIGGEFGIINGYKVRRAARLNRDGSYDPTWINYGNDAAGPSGTVNAVIVQPDGKVLIGGYFEKYLEYNGVTNSYGNNPSRLRIARLNINGQLDNTFNYNTSTNSWLSKGFNSTVNSFLLDASGNIYVGGAFTEYDNVSISTGRIAKLLPDGRLDENFNAGNFDDKVEGLAFQHWQNDGTSKPEAHLLAVGSFSEYSAISNQQNTIRFNFSEIPPTVLAGGISNFTVVKVNNSKNKLSWEALHANSTYIVERSFDGRNFQKNASYYNVNANTILYHEDNVTTNGKVYYRIGIISGNSGIVNPTSSEFSSIVSLNMNSGFSTSLSLTQNEVKVYISSTISTDASFNLQVVTTGGHQLMAKQLIMRNKVINETFWSPQSMKNCLVILSDSNGEVLKKVMLK